MTVKTLEKHGGASLIHKYNSSPRKLLSAVEPKYKESIRESLLKIAKDLNIEKVEDLVNISKEYR